MGKAKLTKAQREVLRRLALGERLNTYASYALPDHLDCRFNHEPRRVALTTVWALRERGFICFLGEFYEKHAIITPAGLAALAALAGKESGT